MPRVGIDMPGGRRVGSRVMNAKRALLFSVALSLFVGAALGPASLRADVIETKNGTRLVGRVTGIKDGKVHVNTDFAGPIVVAQSKVVRITTDRPVAVRLVDGKRYDGRLVSAHGALQVATTTGLVETTVARIAASWKAGAPEPGTVPPHYHWTYEASVNITGKNGNHSQFGSAYGITATLKRKRDTLVLSSNYNRQTTDGVKSADQFRAGADYSDNFARGESWYARDTIGFDRVKELSLYNTAAIGGGYDVIKQPHQTLTLRAGLAHRYEKYEDNVAPSISALGLDLELNHVLKLSNSLLTTHISVVPAFEKFRNFIITQETDFDVPLAKSRWKVRLGFSDNYVSEPPPGIKKLDTTYYGSLVWDFDRLGLSGIMHRAEGRK